MRSIRSIFGRTLCHNVALWLVSAILMAGCGAGGSGTSAGVGTGGTGSYVASLTGAVTDDYLIDAVVFIDKNENYHLDSDESYTVTDIDGIAELDVDSSDLELYPVVAVALKGVTVESSTMLPVVSNYVLVFPKESFSASNDNIISPISTEVHVLLESGQYDTAQQAMDALAYDMDLPDDLDLFSPEVIADYPALSAAAKSIAALMWMQSDQIMVEGSVTPVVDIERYRAMLELIEDNMYIVSNLNTSENLVNLNNNIDVVLEAMPNQAEEQ